MKSLKYLLLLVVLAVFPLLHSDMGVAKTENIRTIRVDNFLYPIPEEVKTDYIEGLETSYQDDPYLEQNVQDAQANFEVRPWVVKYADGRAKSWDADKPDDAEGDPSEDWINFIEAKSADDPILPVGLPPEVKTYDKVILGVKAKFYVAGYNWIILEPSYSRSAGGYVLEGRDGDKADPRATEKPFYIDFEGITKAIDVWVWGPNRNYLLEVHLEDFTGVTHVLPLGRLNFKGWRNLRVPIPNYIQQTQKYLPNVQPLKFIRFKITADPTERTDEFYCYFDYMQTLADVHAEAFFGDKLDKQYLRYWQDIK